MIKMNLATVLGLIVMLVSALSTTWILYGEEAKNLSERTRSICSFVGVIFFISSAFMTAITLR